MVRTMSQFAFFVFVLLVTSIFAVITPFAATYNNIFNNIEQGDNGKSNPTIVLGNGKAKKAPEAEGDTPNEEPKVEPTEPEVGTIEATPRNVVTVRRDDLKEPKYFRFGLLAHTLGPDLSLGPSEGEERQWGGTVGITGYMLRDFGITLLMGAGSKQVSFFGAELEFVPIRVGLFDLENFFEAAVMAGVSNLGRNEHKKGSIHGGIRAGLNLGERYGIGASLRTNLDDRKMGITTMADAGLVVRF